MLGIFSIILALLLLMYFAYRGISVVIIGAVNGVFGRVACRGDAHSGGLYPGVHEGHR
jgi:hypothetical protein